MLGENNILIEVKGDDVKYDDCDERRNYRTHTINRDYQDFQQPIPLTRTVSDKTEDSKTWKSCCLIVDKAAIKYFVQVGVLGSLIIFSCSMLIVEPDCNSQRNYAGLLMVCLGCFLPSPKLN